MTKFPYQIVTFLKKEPELGQTIYSGPKGWLPQVALKRRFTWQGDESSLVVWLDQLAAKTKPIELNFKDAIKPGHMPVRVVEVEPTEPLMNFHRSIFGDSRVMSGHPDREGDSYYPHVTIEWNNQLVVDPDQLINSQKLMKTFWLVSDDKSSEDTQAIHQFHLQ